MSKTREVTCRLLENLEEGFYDPHTMIRDLLNWMSEDEVADFARTNEYLETDETDETD